MSHDKPIRVGYVVKMFPRLSETFILNEILELERLGVDLHIFSLKRPTDSAVHARRAQVRAPVTYLPERIWGELLHLARAQTQVCHQHPRSFGQSLLRGLRRHRRKRLLRLGQACCLIQEMGEIRHLHAHYAMEPCEVAWLAHRLTGITFSVTTHAKDIYQAGRLISPRLREQIAGARFVVANSRSSAQHIAAHLNGQSCRIATIYNGVDLDAFARRNQLSTEPLILSVGRLVEKKGFGDLLAACRILRQRGVRFRCEIVGAGLLRRKLHEMIRDGGLDGHVKLVGPLPQQQLLDYYHRAAVFALPCRVADDGDRDVLPNVLKEAMAVGVPVVTTKLDGIEELIENEVSGVLVPPGDPAALASTLERLLADAALGERLASQARSVVERRFDMRTNFVTLKDMLGDVLREQCMPLEAAHAGANSSARHEPDHCS